MRVISPTKSCWVDVDNTLVFSATEYPTVKGPSIYINNREFIVHTGHVEIIKDFHARGHTIIIWSAGGSRWAEMVVRALKLDLYVSLVIDKPDWFIDDKPSSSFMSEAIRFYKHIEHKDPSIMEKEIG